MTGLSRVERIPDDERARRIESARRVAATPSAYAARHVNSAILDLLDIILHDEPDAARGRHCVKYGEWQRRDDGRTLLVVPVAPGANLSCAPMREDALDEAIRADREGR